MTLSIGTKLTTATLAVLVLVSALLYRELTRRERQSLLASKETAATMVADLFAASLSAPLDFADNDAVKTELDHLEKNPEVICASVFLEKQEAPVARLARGCDASAPISAEDVGHVRFHEDRVEVARIVRGREDAVVGKARIVFSLTRENAAFEASRRQIFWLTLMLALGTASALIVISRTQIVTPLRRLSEAARRVGAGDLATRVDVRSADELGQLASAFNRMSEEIGDRERRLAAATQNLRDLFDHMGQAIVAFDREGRVRGATSRQASRIFTKSDLEGQAIDDLLFGADHEGDVEAEAFREWRETAFDIPPSTFADVAELAPKETTLVREGIALPLELEFRPVAKDGTVDRIMVLATDVSEKRRLEETVATQEEEHAKRMAAMQKLVAGGAQLFVHFIESARVRVAGFFESVTDDGPAMLDVPLVDDMFRHVHTMKGEARAFDLAELASSLEKLEDTLAALRKNGEALSDAETAADAASAIRAGLFAIEKAIERTRQDFIAASPIGSAALEQASVQRADLESALALVMGSDRDDSLARAVRLLGARPFGESLATIAERLPDWATRDGKQVELVVEGREVRVPAKLAAVLPGVMTHLVRNAVAHGIESVDRRLAEGKSAAGTIWATAQRSDEGLLITIEDDGAGIDFERVRERAKELGVDANGTAEPTELVFVAGLSTRESSDGLAGRGVGLDAVRSDLAGAGYAIEVVTEKGQGTKFVLVPVS